MALLPGAVGEETNATATAGASDRDTAPGDSIPFSGNPELKSRLDATGKLTVAGERLRGWLLRRFYAAHGFETVWDGHPAEASRLLRDAVMRAGDHGLDPGLFHSTALAERASSLSPVERDLLLSDAFLSYADALARGALPIEERTDDEDLQPEPVDIVAVIDAAIAAPDPGKAVEALAPTSPEYSAMRRAYAEYRALAGGVQGARNKVQRTIPERPVVERRLRQLVVNLERLRWLPRQMPRDRVVVNAAIARLQLFRDYRPVFTTRVVVGETDKQTPELQSTINDVLLNPPWNIPRSIAQKEILPKLAADPGYLASHHMRFRSNGAIQQEAGPYSSLGRLKFEMDDRYDVYLHDTPTKSLFQSAARMMSHGCVRVENPRTLAVMLLGQSVESIDKGIAAGHTSRRVLPAPVPVFIVYQTAYVESDGSIQFRGDPYDRDEEIWRYLTRAQQLPIAQDSPVGQRKG
ncbi:MAG: L,D-transpeptidase family protein [Alphaproteobacteria bacterium]|nr:L,D-transpeptidase family protein [Alphaproteobacteria bacterium]